MNFLAHLYLSGDFDELMIGNFMADFVKGKPSGLYPHLILKGIELHRRIDTYTDNHPVVKESKKRLQPKYRKYAPVIVDVFYDHFLAAHWQALSPVSLTDFARYTYHLMNNNLQILPPPMYNMLQYMQKENWLVSYMQLTGIERALTGMSRRATFQSNMEFAVQDLKMDYTLYEKEFLQYFPDLIAYVKEWKAANSIIQN